MTEQPWWTGFQRTRNCVTADDSMLRMASNWLALLAVEQVPFFAEDGECGHTLFERDLVLLCDRKVFIHFPDVDVDEDEVGFEELAVGRVVEVDVENLAIAAPVSAEVDEDASCVAAAVLSAAARSARAWAGSG